MSLTCYVLVRSELSNGDVIALVAERVISVAIGSLQKVRSVFVAVIEQGLVTALVEGQVSSPGVFGDTHDIFNGTLHTRGQTQLLNWQHCFIHYPEELVFPSRASALRFQGLRFGTLALV